MSMPAPPPRRFRFPRPVLRLRLMIALVALCGVLAATWRFRRESDPVQNWADTLRYASSPSARVVAAEALATVGVVGVDEEVTKARREESKVAAAALISALRDDDGRVRAAAARSLRTQVVAARDFRSRTAVGPVPIGAEPAVPILSAMLRDPHPPARLAALAALSQLGMKPEELIPLLLSTLKEDADGAVRVAALDLLGSIGRDHAAVFDGLRFNALSPADARWQARAAGERAQLSAIQGRTISALIAALHDGQKSVRLAAARVLLAYAHLPASYVPALIRAMKDPSGEVRATVAELLSRSAPGTPHEEQVAGVLIAGLGDAETRVVMASAVALGYFVPSTARRMHQVLDGRSWQETGQAVDASRAAAELGQFVLWRRGDPRVADALNGLMRRREGPLRFIAIGALGELGDPAALPTFRRVIVGDDPADASHREQALRAVARIVPSASDPNKAIAVLIEALVHPDFRTRGDAADMLYRVASGPDPDGSLRPALRVALPHVDEAGRDSSRIVRSCADAASRAIRAALSRPTVEPAPDPGLRID